MAWALDIRLITADRNLPARFRDLMLTEQLLQIGPLFFRITDIHETIYKYISIDSSG